MGAAQEVCVYVRKANNRSVGNTQHWWEKAMQSTTWKWKWTFRKVEELGDSISKKLRVWGLRSKIRTAKCPWALIIKVLRSLLEEFILLVLNFFPLKRKQWKKKRGGGKWLDFPQLWTYQEFWRPIASYDLVSWEARSGHRINILLLAVELKDFCSNVKAFWEIWDFTFFNDSSPGNTWADKSHP